MILKEKGPQNPLRSAVPSKNRFLVVVTFAVFVVRGGRFSKISYSFGWEVGIDFGL